MSFCEQSLAGYEVDTAVWGGDMEVLGARHFPFYILKPVPGKPTLLSASS